jgi:hypothetical protein
MLSFPNSNTYHPKYSDFVERSAEELSRIMRVRLTQIFWWNLFSPDTTVFHARRPPKPSVIRQIRVFFKRLGTSASFKIQDQN